MLEATQIKVLYSIWIVGTSVFLFVHLYKYIATVKTNIQLKL